MRKVTSFILFVALSTTPLASAAEPQTTEAKDPNAPTYESPILSLLFLPVNLLIKAASVMGPSSTEKPSATPTSPRGPDK
jgi:hypothetical protein